MKIEVTEEMRTELRAVLDAEHMARQEPSPRSKAVWIDIRGVHSTRLARLFAEAVERAEREVGT